MKILNILTILALVWVSCASPQTTNFETKVLLNSVTENILGEQINFPDSNATITSAIRVLSAGESTGIHMHESIPVVYVIEGELTISHQTESGIIEKVIKKGEAFVGANNNWHETKNTSNNDAVAQVVFIGAKNLKNTVAPPPPPTTLAE